MIPPASEAYFSVLQVSGRVCSVAFTQASLTEVTKKSRMKRRVNVNRISKISFFVPLLCGCSRQSHPATTVMQTVMKNRQIKTVEVCK